MVVVVPRRWGTMGGVGAFAQAESEMTLGMSMLPIYRKIRG